VGCKNNLVLCCGSREGYSRVRYIMIVEMLFMKKQAVWAEILLCCLGDCWVWYIM